MKRGTIFQYTDKKGKIIKGFAYREDQNQIFQQYNKVFLRLVNDDFSLKKTEDNKEIIAIKSHCELTLIGFID